MLIAFEGKEPALNPEFYPGKLKVVVRRVPWREHPHGSVGVWYREAPSREIKREDFMGCNQEGILYDITPESIHLSDGGYNEHEYLVRYWDGRATLPSVMPVRLLVIQRWVDDKGSWELRMKGQVTCLDLPSI